MSDNIIPFTGSTTVDLPVEQVLEEAKKAGLLSVTIAGYVKYGDPYVASSMGSIGDAAFQLSVAHSYLVDAQKEKL